MGQSNTVNYFSCSTAKHLWYQLSVRANRSKCYSRYTMQLSDKAPHHQLIVTLIRISYTRTEQTEDNVYPGKNSQKYISDAPNI